jgi:hypothetical protein
MNPQLLVVPIFWGWDVPPSSSSPFNLFDMLVGVIDIMDSHYLDGVTAYGLAAGGAYEYGATVPAGYPVPNPFTDQNCWDIIDLAIAENWVQNPGYYDNLTPLIPKYRAVYTLFVAPGHYYTDPNIFGRNSKQYRPGASACWVTTNSDLAGGLSTFAHELIEAGTQAEIADPCEKDPDFYLNGVRLPKYQVNGACWPDDKTIFQWVTEELVRDSKYAKPVVTPPTRDRITTR